MDAWKTQYILVISREEHFGETFHYYIQKEALTQEEFQRIMDANNKEVDGNTGFVTTNTKVKAFNHHQKKEWEIEPACHPVADVLFFLIPELIQKGYCTMLSAKDNKTIPSGGVVTHVVGIAYQG